MPGHKQGTDLGQTPFLRPRVQPAGVSLGLPPGEFVDPYTAWRTLLTVQRADVQIRGSRANSTVALIRALGGGWDAPTTLSDRGQIQ